MTEPPGTPDLGQSTNPQGEMGRCRAISPILIRDRPSNHEKDGVSTRLFQGILNFY
jgi:hypothetical protein